jgi:signal transduction histidine kinase/ActR/RegA family two-component response regulator
MKYPNIKARFSLRAKLLVPVVGVMVLLTALTVWLVNQRIDEQLETQTSERLYTAKKHFQASEKDRAENLLRQYRNMSDEPKYRSILKLCTEEAFQDQVEQLMQSNSSALTKEEAAQKVQNDQTATINNFLADQLKEREIKIAACTLPSATHPLYASTNRDPQLNADDFKARSRLSVQEAYTTGKPVVDTVGVGSRLLDVVSIPVSMDGQLLGVLTFGLELGPAEAQKMKELTSSEVVLLAGGQVAASSWSHPDSQPALAREIRKFSLGSNAPTAGQPAKILLGSQHYICVPGRFASLSGDDKLGYILASSYETAWKDGEETQRVLALVGLFGTMAGAGIIWLLVRQVTQPLQELRDGVEAVARGDYSRRVDVSSRDECGELAAVFNEMTESIKTSRGELEKTVETLKTTQSQLIQSEKLSGIGEFVAGVAHELNNPLTSVMGFAELLQQSDLPEQQRRYLDVIFKSAKRCQKIVSSLLSFARRHAPERKVICVNEIVESAVEILQYQMRTSNIEVVMQLDPKLPLTEIDPHQMQQVFLNIINNARQAMEGQTTKGQLRVTTETHDDRVRIVFADNGPGIPADNLKKIFNPFFTTKEVGKGTGLGLSLCYGIVSEHGGTITPQSTEGEGATFVIEIPVARKPASSREKKAATPAEAEDKPSQEGVGKRVLVVDDEDSILQMIREALTMNGYKVDVAHDGETALKRLGQYQYDLALCDWKMPGLNGQEVYERLHETNPEMSKRIIFITGDVVNEKTQEFLKTRNKVCLSKPFTLGDFRSAINQVITPNKVN